VQAAKVRDPHDLPGMLDGTAEWCVFAQRQMRAPPIVIIRVSLKHLPQLQRRARYSWLPLRGRQRPQVRLVLSALRVRPRRISMIAKLPEHEADPPTTAAVLVRIDTS
jgi:hypothetical protein